MKEEQKTIDLKSMSTVHIWLQIVERDRERKRNLVPLKVCSEGECQWHWIRRNSIPFMERIPASCFHFTWKTPTVNNKWAKKKSVEFMGLLNEVIFVRPRRLLLESKNKIILMFSASHSLLDWCYNFFQCWKGKKNPQ